MQIRPIISAMRRNKVGAVLIALQMAVTLAILCNALFIITQRLSLMSRPSGVNEADTFTLRSDWIGQPDDVSARQQADLAAVRALPGVADAYMSNSFPLSRSGWLDGVDLSRDQKHSTADSTLYMADDHTINTLGLKLVEGRNFTAADLKDYVFGDNIDAGVIIVTRVLAEKLFPGADAVGRSVFFEDHVVTIVGVVERLQTPWVSGNDAQKFVENSLLVPLHPLMPGARFIVRAQPGRGAGLMQQVQKTLMEVNHARVISAVKPFSQVRAEAYRDDRGLAIILGTVCVSLLGITVFGIVGLTSFWVTQRRRQIGVRRALGATRRAILGYFQTENLLIAAAGTAIGAALAVGLNLWMVSAFEMQRMQPGYVIGAVAAIVLLGQFAVLWPALRAASIPPALATRAS